MSAIRGNKSEITQKKQAIKGAITGRRTELGLTKKQFLSRIKMDDATYWRKMNDPSKFTISEMWVIAAALDWKPADMERILF